MKLGIYLGSFDPIHMGHVHLVQNILEEFALDRVLILPLNDAPHKKSLTLEANKRFELIQSTCKHLENIEASDLEIRHNIVGYSIRMIEIIQEAYKEASLYYILGSDVFINILKWQTINQLINMVEFIVINRHTASKGQTIQVINTLTNLNGKVHLSTLKPLDISSTQIKNNLKSNQSIDGLIPKEIYSEILKLYTPGL